MNGHLEVARLLIEHGADVNQPGARGASPLLGAVSSQSGLALPELLLAHGAAIDAQCNDGWTPLMHAAHWDARWNELSQWLLDRGADPNHISHDDWTPLMLASYDRIVVRGPFSLLIETPSLNVNLQTPIYGWTALMTAVRKSIPEVIMGLLDRGADVHVAMRGSGNKFTPEETLAHNLMPAVRAGAKCTGHTALTWATKLKRAKASALLRAAGANEAKAFASRAPKKKKPG
jgi:ankyrin repeat protein